MMYRKTFGSVRVLDQDKDSTGHSETWNREECQDFRVCEGTRPAQGVREDFWILEGT